MSSRRAERFFDGLQAQRNQRLNYYRQHRAAVINCQRSLGARGAR